MRKSYFYIAAVAVKDLQDLKGTVMQMKKYYLRVLKVP